MSVFATKSACAGGASLLAALFLSSCTVVVDEGPRPLPPRPGPVMCTQEYDPVCAEALDDVRTFGNACTARAEGYSILYRGECRRRAEIPPRQFCTREYAPVCARSRGQMRTFGNACEADSAGYRIVYDGRCARG